MNLIHGGDWAGFYDEYGREPLDFSANVSPLGLPEGVKRAAISALEQAERYPDPLCRSLRKKLSVLHAVSEDNILCGSGAADLIFRLALSLHPQKALVTAPTFAEYEQSLKAAGCEIEHFVLKAEKSFAITDELLDYITPKLSMLFLCEPNNPTGRTTERYLLKRILEKCTACGTVLVVDECFNEFLDKPYEHTMQGELATHKNLVILKAFTKCYAMAGLRLGYVLCGDDTLTQRLREAGQPWAVSNIAQAAGEAALLETQYIERLRTCIAQGRSQLMSGLTSLGGTVYAGEANYLLFSHGDRQLAQKLRKNGVLVRDCANYIGLGGGWYRVAIRTEQENNRLLQVMKEVL